MTVLVGGPKPVAIAEPEIDMSDIASGTATVKTAAVYRLTRGSSFDQFAGNFTYDGSGNLVGGTITGWKRVTGGTAEFMATGFSLPVTAFLGFLFADDAAGFLGAVFGGNDRMTGSATFDDLRGGNGNDTIAGAGGNDSISGGNGNDSLVGGAGGDVLFGDGGNDTMAGGAGADEYFVDDIGDVVNEAAGQGLDLVFATIDYALTANVENLVLNAGAKGTGNDLSNRILGSFSDDTLTGGLGNDSLNGDIGTDLLIGGKGNDLYTINDADDLVNENPGEGTDTIRTSLGSFSLDGPAFANVENLILTSTLPSSGTGNNLANVITGGAGANILDGAGGNDTLVGGDGGDTYFAFDSRDKVVELAGVNSGFDVVNAGIDYILPANVEGLSLLAGAANGTGNAHGNLIFGNATGNKLVGAAGDDDLRGASGADTLDGGAGNDDLQGGNDGDKLLGGAGSDILIGGAGLDFVAGGAGNDNLDGGLGADTMLGGAGSDIYLVDDAGDIITELAGQDVDIVVTTLSAFSLDTGGLKNVEQLILKVQGGGTGNALNNWLIGSNGNDTLAGGLGNDTLEGIFGVDSLAGGKGNDFYIIDNIGDIVTEVSGEGADTLQSSLQNTSLATPMFTNIENLSLVLNAISGTGNGLANIVTGNEKNNSLDGAAGNDTMIGGTGGDTYTVDSARDRIVELAGVNSGFDIVDASVNYTLSANVERLNLTGGAIIGVGNAQSNLIFGNTAVNRLVGAAGSDVLRGETGADTLDGGAGGDFLSGGGDNDKLLGGDGSDILNGGDGLDIVVGGAGNDNLDGGFGADTMLGGAGGDIYFVDDAGDSITELAGQGVDIIVTTLSAFSLDTGGLKNVEHLVLQVPGLGTGNALNNWIVGSDGSDTLIGGLGNDTLEGFFGADTLIGGKGNDFYIIDDAGDIVTEGAGEGTDTVQSSLLDTSLASSMFTNIENLSLVLNAVSGTGNGLANVIAGNEKNNSLDGAAGNDTMIGGTGDDTYAVSEARDRIVELAGANSGFDIVNASVDYVLSANVETLNLLSGAVNGTGNAQDNVIIGNAAANKLFGLAGDDSLSGTDGGGDTLDGGAGNDTLGGSEDDDKLFGGTGNDLLIGDEGADTMAGGAGNDSYVVIDTADQLIEASGQGTDLAIAFGDFAYTLGANVENLGLILGADGSGNALGNRIDGGDASSGDNALSGLGGNDTLIGGWGADAMSGGAGRDTFALTHIDGTAEVITDFAAGKNGDRLDLSDLLTGFVSGSSNPNDFVQFGNAAGDTNVRVDVDGAANGANFVDACLLQGVTLTSVDQAAAAGNLLLA